MSPELVELYARLVILQELSRLCAAKDGCALKEKVEREIAQIQEQIQKLRDIESN